MIKVIGILIGGTCQEEDKCIYNGIVYKKKIHIFPSFLIVSSMGESHLLNEVESFSAPGVHVAWSLELQLMGHWEYSRRQQAFYPAT